MTNIVDSFERTQMTCGGDWEFGSYPELIPGTVGECIHANASVVLTNKHGNVQRNMAETLLFSYSVRAALMDGWHGVWLDSIIVHTCI